MNKLNLAFFVGNSREIISVHDYIKGKENGTILWNPDQENTTIQLVVEGKEYIAAYWSLGGIYYLVPQLAPALQLLKANKTAIIRAAVNDAEIGTYFLFEVSSNSFVSISMFYISDPDYAYIYPNPIEGVQAIKLYQYVLERRGECMSQKDVNTFKNILFPYAELIAALEQEIKWGELFLELYK